MAEAVNSAFNDELAAAARRAQQPGEVAAPEKLIALIAGMEQPLIIAQDNEQARQLIDAFDEDFGFIRLSFVHGARMPRAATPPEAETRYAALVRWLVQELRIWRRAEDSNFRKFVAIMIAAQVCDFGNALWKFLPDDIAENADLRNYLKEFVASFDAAFSAAGGRTPPIWESELVESLQRADAAGDWAAVASIWRRFPPFFPKAPQTEAVRCLHRYDPEGLAESVAKVGKTAVAMQVAGILADEQRLRLALSSENPYIQFAGAYRTLVDWRGSLQSLGDEVGALLSQLLLKVSNDAARWTGWMKGLLGYAELAKPLGHALTEASDAALEGYVNSIQLSPKQVKIDAGRRSVTDCLRVFCAEVSPERRAVLWKLAHARWIEWDFNKADLNQHLMAIHWSDLDYAIVAYALECMDEGDRNRAIQSIRDRMTSLEYHWRPSFTDILTAWNRLLSELQPYAHAANIAQNGGDWLPEIKTYSPFEPFKNQYIFMMYRAM